jgi:hypothetical protein
VNRARGSTTSGSFGGLLRQPPTVWETGRILAEKGGIILRIDTVIGDSLGERSRASAEKGGSGGVHEMRVARHRIGPWHTHGHSKTASAYRHICATCHAWAGRPHRRLCAMRRRPVRGIWNVLCVESEDTDGDNRGRNLT